MNAACFSITWHWVVGNELVLIISTDKYGSWSLLSGLWINLFEELSLISHYLPLNHFFKLILSTDLLIIFVLYAVHLKCESNVCFTGLFSSCMCVLVLCKTLCNVGFEKFYRLVKGGWWDDGGGKQRPNSNKHLWK